MLLIRRSGMKENLRRYLRIKEAARVLGVCEGTLRNWERQGKVASYRNPINGYRLFERSDLERLLEAIRRSRTSTPSTEVPQRDLR